MLNVLHISGKVLYICLVASTSSKLVHNFLITYWCASQNNQYTISVEELEKESSQNDFTNLQIVYLLKITLSLSLSLSIDIVYIYIQYIYISYNIYVLTIRVTICYVSKTLGEIYLLTNGKARSHTTTLSQENYSKGRITVVLRIDTPKQVSNE